MSGYTVTRRGPMTRRGSSPLKSFRPTLEKCLGNSLKLLAIV